MNAPQGKTDTICVQVSDYQSLVSKAKQKEILLGQIENLNTRIANYQQIIEQLNDKDSATVEGYQLEIKALNEERKIFLDQVSTFEKMVRKERRKRTLTAIAGTLTTAGAIYLYITK